MSICRYENERWNSLYGSRYNAMQQTAMGYTAYEHLQPDKLDIDLARSISIYTFEFRCTVAMDYHRSNDTKNDAAALKVLDPIPLTEVSVVYERAQVA